MAKRNNPYEKFIASKFKKVRGDGFSPLWIPDFLFDFQQLLVSWACETGRTLIAADCGLGKTPMQLVWAENVVRKTNGRVLILTPLAVSHQTQLEAEKFGIECVRSVDGKSKGRITVTNYEKLHYFDPDDYAGVVCDESSILKNFGGKRKRQITSFMSQHPYRLLCTATAAPNDVVELGTSSEALGYIGYTDMVTKFFKEDIKKDHLGWGRKTYRFRGHAEVPFWRWACSWIRACRRPSDFGFSDEGFQLPLLHERETVVDDATPRRGMLIPIPAKDLKEQRDERRLNMKKRCEVAAEIANQHEGPSVLWCHLNEEADTLVSMVEGAEQVSGQMSDERKEEYLLAFQRGQLKRLITKPKIGCFGLNWQHCSNVVCFPSHSWEQYYQAVRRCWRFGQEREVVVSVVSTPGERRVLANLQRKSKQADAMFTSIVSYMNEAMKMDPQWVFPERAKLPSWCAPVQS